MLLKLPQTRNQKAASADEFFFVVQRAAVSRAPSWYENEERCTPNEVNTQEEEYEEGKPQRK